MARKTEPKRQSKLINLRKDYRTVLRPLGKCVLTIVPETHNGKIRIRVWGEDGVEIEHFRVSP